MRPTATSARAGSILLVVATALTVLMGASAWVVDLAAGLQARTHHQAAADAGALAAAYHLLPGAWPPSLAEAYARTAAIDWVGRNGCTIYDGAVSLWNDPTPGSASPSGGVPIRVKQAVIVGWEQPIDTHFARIFGVKTMPVAVKAAATLGGVTQIPKAFLPFGVPAYQDANGQWWALGSPSTGDYRLLKANPPTPLVLKVGSHSNHSGNFLALSLDGERGADAYEEHIRHGAHTAYAYGSVVDTETGNMTGPTKQGVGARLALGPRSAEVYLPLIKRAEWENNDGRSQVTLIGFVSARITQVTNQAEVYAEFTTRIVPAPAKVGLNQSPGSFAPVLILPPT